MTSHSRKAMAIVVMGVSGSGKSTFASSLSQKIGATFIEGDDLHPQSNIAKMSQAIPLEDADRWPWLQSITKRCQKELQNGSVVVTCSALKKAYRDQLRQISDQLVLVHLTGDKPTISQRMSDRVEHFMPDDLIDSQFDTLENTEGEHDVVELDIGMTTEDQISLFHKQLRI